MTAKHVMLVAICALSLFCGACTHSLAQRIVEAPNGNTGFSLPLEQNELRIPVGPPSATISAFITEPPNKAPARGTILVLHGILGSHDFVQATASKLNHAGYRTVALDLRGHGRSTGQYITYGVVESHDLSQVLDYLQSHHLAEKTVGVYGCSYGASTAIEFAGSDPRVKAVVAVAPFASLADEAPHFGRTMVPIPGLFLSDADYTEVLAEAGKIASFNPDNASPLKAITKTTAPILLIHGDLDAITPIENSQKLHAAAPNHSELLALPTHGHMTVSSELDPTILEKTQHWFDTHLAPKPLAKQNP